MIAVVVWASLVVIIACNCKLEKISSKQVEWKGGKKD